MKILIINSSDSKGGAARAALRLHNAFLKNGLSSYFLCLHKGTSNVNVIQKSDLFSKIFDVFRPKLERLYSLCHHKKISHAFSSPILPNPGLVKEINKIKPDIVNLHWINGGMLCFEDILKIEAPIVWTLHDNWLLTGGCHVFGSCNKYKNGCGNCPTLNSNKKNDLSSRNLLKKKLFLNKLNESNMIHLICLSNWLLESANKSITLPKINKSVIGNTIDTNVFINTEKNIARKKLKIKPNKLIIFGALSPKTDWNKGFKFIVEAVKMLSSDITIGIFGDTNSKMDDFFNVPVINFGRVNDDDVMGLIYSSADLVLVPSKQENLSNTIMESMACSTPVVSFDIGGNSDLITHMEDGYLAKPFSIKSFAEGIEWILNNGVRRNPRQSIISKFNSEDVTKKYLEVFNNIIRDV